MPVSLLLKMSDSISHSRRKLAVNSAFKDQNLQDVMWIPLVRFCFVLFLVLFLIEKIGQNQKITFLLLLFR